MTNATHTELLLALEPLPDAAAAARRALKERGLHPDIAHTVSLLTSEVVGNAVRHANLQPGDKIVLHARLEEDCARVDVADPGRGFDPEVRHSAAGFGLRLIDKLAADWSVRRSERGCTVSFVVDRSSGQRFRRPAGYPSASSAARRPLRTAPSM
jgi:anti-sigma regulatory factor (Ser/Thr protein kinase)